MVDLDAELWRLDEVAILTGSVAFGVSAPSSDEDWLISREKYDRHFKRFFESEEYPFQKTDDEESSGEGRFVSRKKGKIELIVYENEKFRRNWMRAHNHCLRVRPVRKRDRVNIFRYYLYDEDLNPALAIARCSKPHPGREIVEHVLRPDRRLLNPPCEEEGQPV